MIEAPPDDRARREYRLALSALLLLVVARSAVFVFSERAHFDADQAITGLMAKHLAELRAFPLFYYGQSYMLAVEAWLAAPVFALLGVSVATLKLPLLAINLVVTWLLVRGFVRETSRVVRARARDRVPSARVHLVRLSGAPADRGATR